MTTHQQPPSGDVVTTKLSSSSRIQQPRPGSSSRLVQQVGLCAAAAGLQPAAAPFGSSNSSPIAARCSVFLTALAEAAVGGWPLSLGSVQPSTRTWFSLTITLSSFWTFLWIFLLVIDEG